MNMKTISLLNWTILVSIISSITAHLFMKYKSWDNILLNFTDFTEKDIKKFKGLIKWIF